MLALIVAFSVIAAAGCGAKDTAATPETSQKPTPAQEAAKQKAIDQGPAISAANQYSPVKQ